MHNWYMVLASYVIAKLVNLKQMTSGSQNTFFLQNSSPLAEGSQKISEQKMTIQYHKVTDLKKKDRRDS